MFGIIIITILVILVFFSEWKQTQNAPEGSSFTLSPSAFVLKRPVQPRSMTLAWVTVCLLHCCGKEKGIEKNGNSMKTNILGWLRPGVGMRGITNSLWVTPRPSSPPTQSTVQTGDNICKQRYEVPGSERPSPLSCAVLRSGVTLGPHISHLGPRRLLGFRVLESPPRGGC